MSESVQNLRRVDRSDPTPKYVQAQRILAEAIREGRLPAGAKLPPTKELGLLVDVSLLTAQKALEGLVDAGLLRREVGRGTFVCDDVTTGPLSRVRSLAIGVVLDPSVNINDHYHSTIIECLRRKAREDTEHVELFFLDRFSLRRSRFDAKYGVIAIHPPVEALDRVERLADQAPVVLLGGLLPGNRIPSVECDHRGGAEAAVRHLVRLGHHRFLIVSGSTHRSSSHDRATGVHDALLAAGIRRADEVESASIALLDDRTSATIAGRLIRPKRPTAILADGFFVAMGCVRIARNLGLSVPGDLSVVSFEDSDSAPLLDPPLTSVRQPLDRMAAQAYASLREALLSEGTMQESHVFPPELIVRGSTGPARGG